MAKATRTTRTVRVIFTLIGLGLLVGGGILSFLAYDFTENALSADGRVVSVETTYSDDGVSYRPTIRYIDFRGRKQRGVTFMSSSSYNYPVGTEVAILYDIRDPESIRMDNWLATWGIGVIAIAASVVPLGIATIIAKLTKTGSKPKRKRSPVAKPKEEEMVEVRGRVAGLVSRESRSDHERETNYQPTVRRNR